MGRVRIQSYKTSKSAKALSRYLNIKRLRVNGSRFYGKIGDTIINWGKIPYERVIPRAHYLNDLVAVERATNKLETLKLLTIHNVPVPSYEVSKGGLCDAEGVWIARHTLYGHSGKGIEVFEIEDENSYIPDAYLYTKYIDKISEYRVIVVGDKAVDVKVKKKKSDYEGERDPYVWNHTNGYVFARNVGNFPILLEAIGIQAIKALGLTYGAVDIIEDPEGQLLVLEVNTAFGLEGQTIELVGNAIKELL